MKKVLKVCNKPLVLISALIAGVAVVLARFFMTKDSGKDEE
ncbi:MAG: hypothetical protein WC323_02555 [Patescibacteria group bacterium]|jgi:hypothetical protein